MKFLTIYVDMEKEENQNQENTTTETSNEAIGAEQQLEEKPVSYTHLRAHETS